jgi:hypothetical protein
VCVCASVHAAASGFRSSVSAAVGVAAAVRVAVEVSRLCVSVCRSICAAVCETAAFTAALWHDVTEQCDRVDVLCKSTERRCVCVHLLSMLPRDDQHLLRWPQLA